MNQSRVVLDPEIRAIVDQIQQKTRTTSPSAAIALMISRYGRHLLETWELSASSHPDPNPSNYYAPAPVPAPSDFKFSEPLEGL